MTAKEAHEASTAVKIAQMEQAKRTAKDILITIYDQIKNNTLKGKFNYIIAKRMDSMTEEVVCNELRLKGYHVAETGDFCLNVLW